MDEIEKPEIIDCAVIKKGLLLCRMIIQLHH